MSDSQETYDLEIYDITDDEWQKLTFPDDTDLDCYPGDDFSDGLTIWGGSSRGSSGVEVHATSRESSHVTHLSAQLVINAYSEWLKNYVGVCTLDRRWDKTSKLNTNLDDSAQAGGNDKWKYNGSDSEVPAPARWGDSLRTKDELTLFKSFVEDLKVRIDALEKESAHTELGSAPPFDRTQAAHTVYDGTELSGLSPHPRAPVYFGKLLTRYAKQQDSNAYGERNAKQKHSHGHAESFCLLYAMTKRLERATVGLSRSPSAATLHSSRMIPLLQTVAFRLFDLDSVTSQENKNAFQKSVREVNAASRSVWEELKGSSDAT